MKRTIPRPPPSHCPLRHRRPPPLQILEELDRDLRRTFKYNVAWGTSGRGLGLSPELPTKSPPSSPKTPGSPPGEAPLVTPVLQQVTRRLLLAYLYHCRGDFMIGKAPPSQSSSLPQLTWPWPGEVWRPKKGETQGYVQGMDGVAATLLLVLPEDQAFYCLASIYEDMIPQLSRPPCAVHDPPAGLTIAPPAGWMDPATPPKPTKCSPHSSPTRAPNW